MTSSPLLLEADLSVEINSAKLTVTSDDGELFIDIPTVNALRVLATSSPSEEVLKPLFAYLEPLGLADTPCHIRVLGKRVLTFPLKDTPLNVKSALVKYLNSLLP